MHRRLEPFQPIEGGRVRMYTCGPTVYDYAHIGNFRAYTWEDCLRRFLKYRGFQVHQVMNITDVDDKIIRDSAAGGVSIDEFTAQYIEAFFRDLDALNIERAEEYPRATRHIDEMVELCRRLSDKGHTYTTEGSLYFKIDTFPDYGKLAHIDLSGIRPGARVELDEYAKDDARDFVLWKARKEGEPHWATPLGEGRPGWHLECSAMSMKYLGESFDIHTGGVDNMFPHHENEIAQSEAATGKPFVKFWMHCEHLLVDGEKMSKSKGNFYTLVDLLDRGLDPRAIRYFLLTAHYRRQLNFTLEGVGQAAAALSRLEDFQDRLDREPPGPSGDLVPRLEHARRRFDAALDDDLNTSGALGAGFDILREANTVFDQGKGSADEREGLKSFFQDLRSVFGIKDRIVDLTTEIEQLISKREEARRSRDFATADAIRDELLSRDIVLEDTPQGVRWKRKS
jgi:cysteinyl-tRNA synthetase